MKVIFSRFIPFFHKPNFRQFYKFGIVGVLNTAIDFSVYYLLTRSFDFFATHIWLANVLAFSVAVTNSFYWNRRWTFRSANKKKALQYVQFVLVYVVGVCISTLLLSVLVYALSLHDMIAKVFATAIALLWNFFINRWWVFREGKSLVKTP